MPSGYWVYQGSFVDDDLRIKDRDVRGHAWSNCQPTGINPSRRSRLHQAARRCNSAVFHGCGALVLWAPAAIDDVPAGYEQIVFRPDLLDNRLRVAGQQQPIPIAIRTRRNVEENSGLRMEMNLRTFLDEIECAGHKLWPQDGIMAHRLVAGKLFKWHFPAL